MVVAEMRRTRGNGRKGERGRKGELEKEKWIEKWEHGTWKIHFGELSGKGGTDACLTADGLPCRTRQLISKRIIVVKRASSVRII